MTQLLIKFLILLAIVGLWVGFGMLVGKFISWDDNDVG